MDYPEFDLIFEHSHETIGWEDRYRGSCEAMAISPLPQGRSPEDRLSRHPEESAVNIAVFTMVQRACQTCKLIAIWV